MPAPSANKQRLIAAIQQQLRLRQLPRRTKKQRENKC
jgi:hypothetical protein